MTASDAVNTFRFIIFVALSVTNYETHKYGNVSKRLLIEMPDVIPFCKYSQRESNAAVTVRSLKY